MDIYYIESGMARFEEVLVTGLPLISGLNEAMRCMVPHLHFLKDTCKIHKHKKLKDQRIRLKSILSGLYQYFGIGGNFKSINRMYQIAIYAWFKWDASAK